MNGPGRAIKALLLEDHPRDVALVTALLEQEGLECDLHHVTTGQEFAVALKKGPFDLIISDYSLPSFNGFAALALRQELAPDVPFVLFSGTIGEEPAVESLKRGGDGLRDQTEARAVGSGCAAGDPGNRRSGGTSADRGTVAEAGRIVSANR